jgi:hypothetical protein
MEKLSDEELYEKAMIARDRSELNGDEGDHYSRKYKECKAELLSRLSKGQRAILAMEKIISARQVYITHNINTDVYVGRIKDILKDYEQAKESVMPSGG